MRGLTTGLVLLLWLWFAPWLSAQEVPRAELLPPEQSFTVGDRMTLNLVVVHHSDYRLILPQLESPWGDLEPITVRLLVIRDNGDGTETTQAQIDVTAWEPGIVETPPLQLQLADTEGELQSLTAEGVALTVISVVNPEDLTLRDIKPQASLPQPPLWPRLAALASAGVTLIALLAFWLIQRSRRPKTEAQPAPDLRPAHVIALAELEAIVQQDLPGRGAFQQHYSLVTDAVRRYIECAWRVPAMDQTSQELRQALQAAEALDDEAGRQLDRLLREADFVKFARVQPAVATAHDFPDLARRFIELSHRKQQAKLALNGQEEAVV